MEQNNREILENFVIDNVELERIEELTSQFNIFQALNIAEWEVRHSNFLAWLMDPSETHGLNDYFLKKLLLRVSSLAKDAGLTGLSPIDIAIMDFSEVSVRREWRGIDILVFDEENGFVCVVENKIRSGEHSDQLGRYRDLVEKEFPGLKKQLVFLTPDAKPASDERYLSVSYDVVCETIEHVIRAKRDVLSDEVNMFLKHYVEMVRRQVVFNSEIQDLCRKIYTKHRKALDLIFQYRPDVQLDIQHYLTELIDAEPSLLKDDSSKSYIRFVPKVWDAPMLLKGQGWTSSNRLLLFEFRNSPNSLSLCLVIGPGDMDVRQRLYDVTKKYRDPFKGTTSKLYPQWTSIYNETFLRTVDYEDQDIEALKPKIEKKWQSFLDGDLPKLVEPIGSVIR